MSSRLTLPLCLAAMTALTALPAMAQGTVTTPGTAPSSASPLSMPTAKKNMATAKPTAKGMAKRWTMKPPMHAASVYNGAPDVDKLNAMSLEMAQKGQNASVAPMTSAPVGAATSKVP